MYGLRVGRPGDSGDTPGGGRAIVRGKGREKGDGEREGESERERQRERERERESHRGIVLYLGGLVPI